MDSGWKLTAAPRGTHILGAKLWSREMDGESVFLVLPMEPDMDDGGFHTIALAVECWDRMR